jgi:cell division protease FtsH
MSDMAQAMEHCHRPLWKRPPFWFIVIVVTLLLYLFVIEQTDKPTLTPYSTFLDQLEVGNVASVTLQGTEINGHYKHPLDRTPLGGTKVQRDTFISRAPDFGDPTLIPELRKQHVVIEVNSPSQWTSLLTHLPWPMLLFLGVAILAGFVRLTRGGKSQQGSAATMPAHGMVGFILNLFAKREQTSSPPTNDSDEPRHH